MRKILMTIAAFALLSVGACDKDEVVKAANNVADQQPTGVPWLDLGKGALGLALAVAGIRTSKAVYGAVQYPKKDYTPEERAEITEIVVNNLVFEKGLGMASRLTDTIEVLLERRGWVKPPQV